MHSHVPERHSWIRLVSHESLGTSLQQRGVVAGACGRQSARNDSRNVHINRMLRALHAAGLHTGTPSAYNGIGALYAIENWGIELWSGNATRYGLNCIAQSHQQYCLQAANGFAKGQLFLDSGTSTTLIHDVSMLVNERCLLSEPKMVMGLTGPQAIKFTGDLCLEMLNMTGKSSKMVLNDVYYNPFLQYNLVSVTDISRTGHVTTFSAHSNQVKGPAGALELIKTCGVYALPSAERH